jgi:hypothetical protein
LKKLFFILFIFFFSITSSFAVFFIGAQGEYAATSQYKPVKGGGADLGFNISNDVNFLLKSSYGTNTMYKGTIKEVSYNYATATAGIEYIPSISILEAYKLQWKNSINIGASRFETHDKGVANPYTTVLMDVKDSTKGVATSFWTGLQYNYTQYIAPSFNVGYNKSIFSAGSGLSIHGWQVALGVRFYIGGSKDYDSEY